MGIKTDPSIRMKAIYNPKGQALEYGEWAANPYRGCGHKCGYCYVPTILRMPRAEFNAGAVLREGFLGAFEHDAQKLQEQGKRINIFFSFTTDLYHPGDTTPSRRVLELAHKYGHTFTVLTKGGSRALRDIDLYQENDHFAATLTVLDNNFVSKWERDAAPWQDRIAALVKFHRAGIFTWVSIEPGFNADSSIAILEELSSVVDFFKIGRANYLPITKTIDWKDYTLRILDTVTRLGVQAYFKKDLQEFLPTGIPNQPLRPNGSFWKPNKFFSKLEK